ncbi:hypothetical protein [Arthrobacter glacialis]|nr:hypothetical protein [Arthrobacter glacialis]
MARNDAAARVIMSAMLPPLDGEGHGRPISRLANVAGRGDFPAGNAPVTR